MQCEGLMCGEVQFEGACDEGNERVSCGESSIPRKKFTSGVLWRVRATIALPTKIYSAFQNMAILMKVSSL